MRSARTTFALGLWSICTVVQCGGNAFSSSSSNASNTGGQSSTVSTASGGVSGDDLGGASATGGDNSDTGGATAGTGTAPVACEALTPDAADVYVDQRFLGSTPTGTKDCPFLTILDSVNAPKTAGITRTIHVAGDSPALAYQETTRVIVSAGVVLLGAGPDRVTVTATGSCASLTCAVHVQADAILDGITVTCPQGNGIVTGAMLANSAHAAIVRNVTASDSAAHGIVALGDVELGPGLQANHNGLPNNGHGVSAEGAGLVHVRAGLQKNQFNNNGYHGINVAAGAQLQFEGGEASNNGNNGIRLDQKSAQPPLVHVIQSVTASNNPNNGVAVYGGSLNLRSSTLLANTNSGLSFAYAGGNSLDIGTSADPGGNVFGGQTAANRNGKAGVYLCGPSSSVTPAALVQPAEGNQWSMCAPSQASLATCGTLPSVYTDLVIAPPSSVAVSVVACSPGP